MAIGGVVEHLTWSTFESCIYHVGNQDQFKNLELLLSTGVISLLQLFYLCLILRLCFFLRQLS